MNNPYEASKATTGQASWSRTWAQKLHLVVSVLIAVVCGYFFLEVWIDVVRYLLDGRPDPGNGQLTYAQLGIMVLPAFMLALGGIFLAFGRRLSVFFFAAYLLLYVLRFSGTDRFNVVAIAMVTAFIGYALYRWKAGQLKGWPYTATSRDAVP